MRLITVAIHTYEKAIALRALLEREGIAVQLNNVNLEVPGFSSGVRVRIQEKDLPLALRIIENRELFAQPPGGDGSAAKSYLVPVDFSEHSFKAVGVAARLAFERNAAITLLYSYIDPYINGKIQLSDALSYEVGDSGVRHIMEQNALRLMENFAERIREAMRRGEIPVVGFSQKVVEGVPEDSIVDYAKEATPHLIVMGTRGAAEKEADMIGSVTAEVLDEGRFTVLTVPGPIDAATSLEPREILFFCNLDQDDILAMDTLYRLYGKRDARVTIMHIPKHRRFSDSAAEKALGRLNEYCRGNFSRYEFAGVPVGMDEDSAFASLSKEKKYDLIVIPNRRRNAFSRLFRPGLANNILFRTDVPMLVIPV